MNAKQKLICLGWVFAVIFGREPAKADLASTNPPPRLTVELRDGSRVVGDSVEKDFKFHSGLLGDLKLAVADIRSVEAVSTNTAKLTAANGDVLMGAFADTKLTVKADFGKVDLSVGSIRKFTVAAGIKAGVHPAGLVALWPGEGSGADIVGGHDASVSGWINYLPAQKGLGFDFGKRPGRIIVPDAADLNFGSGQNFSIVGWIKPSRYAGAFLRDDIMSFVDKRDCPDNMRCKGYEFNLWHGQVHCRLSDSMTGNGLDWGPAGPDLRDGRFHHIALAVDRNSPAGGKMYVDGREVLTFDPTGVPGDLSSQQPLRIGNHPDPAYQCFFQGLVDEVAIYDRALSTDEIQSICVQENNGELPAPASLPQAAPSGGMYRGVFGE